MRDKTGPAVRPVASLRRPARHRRGRQRQQEAVLAWRHGGRRLEEDKLQWLPDASELCDVFAGEIRDIFETIDNLAQKAEAQCAASIVTLMGMLAAEERFPQVTQHLIRTVLDKAVLVQRKDAMAIRGGETAQSRSTGRRPTRRDRCAARRTPSGTGG